PSFLYTVNTTTGAATQVGTGVGVPFPHGGDFQPLTVNRGHAVTVTAGGSVTGRDIGNQAQSGTVSGTKFNDLNGNGQFDGGEPGLSGWTVYADLNNNGALDGGEPSAVTGAGGTYTLTLAPGNYTIREVPQSGWVQTAPQSGRLFAARSTGPTPTILELNPTTGAVLNSFPAPAAAAFPGPQGRAARP